MVYYFEIGKEDFILQHKYVECSMEIQKLFLSNPKSNEFNNIQQKSTNL